MSIEITKSLSVGIEAPSRQECMTEFEELIRDTPDFECVIAMMVTLNLDETGYELKGEIRLRQDGS